VELDAHVSTEGIAKQDVQVQVNPPSLPGRCEIAVQVDNVQADESSGTSAEVNILVHAIRGLVVQPGF
jgi:hypothetical protein